MKTKEQEILDAIRRGMPVGYIPNHTDENMPEMVAYHVKRSGLLGAFEDEAAEILGRDDCSVKDFIRFMNRLIDSSTS